MIPIRQMLCANGLTVDQVLERRPWLHLFGNWNSMEQRVRDYDESYFLVHNVMMDRIELHCAENYGDTMSFVVIKEELDNGKLIERIRRTDQKTRGIHTIYDEMELQKQKHQQSLDRELKNSCETIAKELYPVVKKTFANY